MIIYFSATGNSKYTAERIACGVNDTTVSMTSCMKNGQFKLHLGEGEALGIVSPTYAWGLPGIVKEFLQKLELDRTPSYIWFAATYGTTPGQTGYFTNEILKEKNYPVSAYFSVKMPDTWTPAYDLSNQAHVKEINEKAEPQIDFILNQIKNRTKGDFMQRKVPVLIAKCFYNMEYDSMRKTSHFAVEDTCIGCGLCVKNCPVSAIDLLDKKPIWNKERCVMCLSCLHHCPKFAIQYGKRTKNHGQYIHPPFINPKKV